MKFKLVWAKDGIVSQDVFDKQNWSEFECREWVQKTLLQNGAELVSFEFIVPPKITPVPPLPPAKTTIPRPVKTPILNEDELLRKHEANLFWSRFGSDPYPTKPRPPPQKRDTQHRVSTHRTRSLSEIFSVE